jgi:deazaflavin-dependent oxidoreductase (nitroreductase family)
MATLRHVDPMARRSRLTPLMARLGTNRVANVISRRIGWKLDPILLRLTGGRLAMTLVIPTAVLETVGARSGHPRRNAVIYFHDGPNRAVIAASNAGRPRHPDWYYNLKASPNVTLGGVSATAAIVDDPGEQERLWALADRVFPAFAVYRRSAAAADLTIPLIALDLAETTR